MSFIIILGVLILFNFILLHYSCSSDDDDKELKPDEE